MRVPVQRNTFYDCRKQKKHTRSDILLSYSVYWWAMDMKIIFGIVVVVIVLAVYLFGPTAVAYYNGAIKKD